MDQVFDLVYKLLKWISAVSGFTYREINIIVYFIIIPSLFSFLLSKIFNQKYIVLGFLAFIALTVLLIPNFEIFSHYLFDYCVDFLNWFQHLGMNYIQASVVICVIIPTIIIGSLLYFKNKTSNNIN
ncbi:hypothetical protein [Tenacibaculum agarivorans]|uniref:hypothetical protein n=1 Tax=Tenacibaculum agarivorans TaxID=1908389 RepID=UPI00094BC330|nr:hypothetical protein [Tenacibaculum agarivorans]